MNVETFVLERFFFLEYHFFGYLITNGYYQNHVDNNIILLGRNQHTLFLEQCMNCIFMKAVISFSFNNITNEVVVNDGIRFVRFFVTSFVIGFISCTTKLCWNSIHFYLLFVFKFVV